MPVWADSGLLEEISSLEDELQRINAERDRVRTEMQRESEEFSEYSRKIAQRKESFTAAIDSLREQINSSTDQRDSVLSDITGIESTIRQHELLQNSIRRQLNEACEDLISLIDTLPPDIRDNTRNTLEHLSSELQSGRIGNIEALQRYVSITNRIEKLSFEIDVSETESPVRQIRGTVYRIRIGNFFEAIADPEQKRMALWTGYDQNGQAQWLISDDPQLVTGVIEAANMSMGQMVPSFVEIPFGLEEEQ